MLAQLADRFGRSPTPTARGNLLGQKLHGAVHADRENLIKTLKIGIGATALGCAFGMFQVGAITPDIGPNIDAILGVRPDQARQRQQFQRGFQLHLFRAPFFRDRLARRLLVVV